jgi:hypothetical protein
VIIRDRLFVVRSDCDPNKATMYCYIIGLVELAL